MESSSPPNSQSSPSVDLVPLSVHDDGELPYKVPDSTLPYHYERFVQEYVLSGNPKKAYVRAFGEGAAKDPAGSGRSLLRSPSVVARIRVHQHAIATMSVKTTDTLVRELEEIVEADVNELVEIKVGACRYCHGFNHLYLWRDMVEYEKAVNDCLLKGRKDIPQMEGGVGYRFNVPPHPDCPQCEGQGIQQIRINESDGVTPGARRLFKGVECHPDGSIKKVLLVDQFAARQELHRIRGMHIERSLNVNATVALPNAKDIAASPDRVNEYLESLHK